MRRKRLLMVGVFLMISFLAVAFHSFIPEWNKVGKKGEGEGIGPREQASQFIAYYHSIALTPEQEEIKNEALSLIPAPCCSDFSVATCCCPCNLAKSVWGLSHFLIAKRGYNAQQVRKSAEEWIRQTNESGYAGNACYKRRCNEPFEKDGCGGMNENRIS